MKRLIVILLASIIVNFSYWHIGLSQVKIVEKTKLLELPRMKTQYTIAKDRRVLEVQGERPTQRLVLVSRRGTSKKIIKEAQKIVDPRFSSDGSKISFNFRDATRIFKGYIVDLKKGTKILISRAGLNVGDLSLSPKGNLIAYAVEQVSRKNHYDVIIDNYKLSLGIRIKDGYLPVWSPDGTQIAFQRSEKDPFASRWISYIWLVDKDGKNERKLLSSKGCAMAIWSPTGKKFADSNGDNISIVDVEKDKCIKVGSYCSHDPSWSPDGKKLAFCQPYFEEPVNEGISAGSDIFIVNADGSNLLNLTSNPRHKSIENPVWLSSNEIAVKVYEKGKYVIKVLRVE